MKIYNYIKRIRNIIEYQSIQHILWDSKHNKIMKLKESLILKRYNSNIQENVSSNDIKDFYRHVYLPLISSKENPNIINIVDRIDQWKINEKIYTFIEIKNDQWKLLWWTILSHKRYWNTLTSWFLATLPWYEYLYEYMEYLFLQYAIENKFTNISLWTTWNLCWYNKWSWIWVVFHKLRQNTIPTVTKGTETQEINLNSIKRESILFFSEDDKKYNKAMVFLPKDIHIEDKKKYLILEKRGIQIEYNYF